MENNTEESLSVEDKALIKQAVLENAVANSYSDPVELTKLLAEAFREINQL